MGDEVFLADSIIHSESTPPNGLRTEGSHVLLLPPELFLEVVRHYTEPKKHLQDLHRLMQVCREWQHLIQSTMSLWSSIDASEAGPLIRKALKNVGTAPLDLDYTDRRNTIECEELFALWKEKAGQWRSLTVEFDDVVLRARLELLQTLWTPRLELLQLSVTYVDNTDDNGPLVELFNGRPAPSSLRDITLAGVPISFGTLRLQNMRRIDLSLVPRVLLIDLIHTLAASPLLEILELHALQIIDNETLHPQCFPVRLQSLTNLTIGWMKPPWLARLLSIIAAPNLQSFGVRYDSSDDPTILSDLFAGMRHQISTFSTLISQVSSYSIAFTVDHRYSITIGGLSISVSVGDEEFAMERFPEMFFWIKKNLGRDLKPLPAELTISSCIPKLPSLEWLTRETTVTEVCIRDHPDYGSDAADITILGKPSPSKHSIWLLPQVEVLKTNLVWEEMQCGLIHSIRERQDAGTEREKSEGLVPPKPLREIWLWTHRGEDPLEDEVLNQVSDVAIGADVYWQAQKWPREIV